MMRRFAAVIWWVGALTCALALFVAGRQFLAQSGCSELIAKSAGMERKQAAAYQAAVAEFHRKFPGAKLTAADEFDLIPAGESFSLSVEESAELKGCERGTDLFAALFLAFVTVMLWSAAFVFGGRFWLPPARSV